MKKQLLAVTLAAATITATPTAQADNVALTLQGGTTGLGAGLVYGLTEKLNLRGSCNRFTYDIDESTDDIDYELELELSTAELLIDWHVFDGGFRLSAGAMQNGNSLGGRGTPPEGQATVEWGGQVFNTSDH